MWRLNVAFDRNPQPGTLVFCGRTPAVRIVPKGDGHAVRITSGGCPTGFLVGTSGFLCNIGCSRLMQLIEGRMAFSVIGEDRKSTRLNSSHVEISYAVF